MKALLAILALWLPQTLLWAQTGELEISSERGERFEVFINGYSQGPAANYHLLKEFRSNQVEVRVLSNAPSARYDVKETAFLYPNTRTTYRVTFARGRYQLTYISRVSLEEATPVPTTPDRPEPRPRIDPPQDDRPEPRPRVDPRPRPGRPGRPQPGTHTPQPGNPGPIPPHLPHSPVPGYPYPGQPVPQPPYPGQPVPQPPYPGQPYPPQQPYPGQYDPNYVYPIRDRDFNQLMNRLRAEVFESDRLERATNALAYDYFTTAQVGAILKLFVFESNRLDLAKKGYRRTVDPHNYLQLLDLLTFRSSKNELEVYVNGVRR